MGRGGGSFEVCHPLSGVRFIACRISTIYAQVFFAGLLCGAVRVAPVRKEILLRRLPHDLAAPPEARAPDRCAGLAREGQEARRSTSPTSGGLTFEATP